MQKTKKYPKQAKNLRDLETETCLSETVLDEFFSSEKEKKQGQRKKAANKRYLMIPLHILENGGAQDYILESIVFLIKIITNNEIRKNMKERESKDNMNTEIRNTNRRATNIAKNKEKIS